MGAQKNHLIEIVLLSTHNICFGWEIKKKEKKSDTHSYLGAWHSLCLFYRLEGAHPGHGLMTEGYTRNADSPISEDPDYAEESENGGETEHYNERGKVPVSIGLDKQTFWAQKCKYFNNHQF